MTYMLTCSCDSCGSRGSNAVNISLMIWIILSKGTAVVSKLNGNLTDVESADHTLNTASDPVTLHLGILIPLHGDIHIEFNALGAIPVAMQRVRENWNGYFQAIADHGMVNFTFSMRDTYCRVGKGLTSLIDLWMTHEESELSAFIGKCNGFVEKKYVAYELVAHRLTCNCR